MNAVYVLIGLPWHEAVTWAVVVLMAVLFLAEGLTADARKDYSVAVLYTRFVYAIGAATALSSVLAIASSHLGARLAFLTLTVLLATYYEKRYKLRLEKYREVTRTAREAGLAERERAFSRLNTA